MLLRLCNLPEDCCCDQLVLPFNWCVRVIRVPLCSFSPLLPSRLPAASTTRPGKPLQASSGLPDGEQLMTRSGSFPSACTDNLTYEVDGIDAVEASD